VFALLVALAAVPGAHASPAQDIAREMTNAWERLGTYRTSQVIQERVRGSLGEEQKIRVAFRKPWEIQLEWDTVHPGRKVYWSATRHSDVVHVDPGGLAGRAVGILTFSIDNGLLKRDTNYTPADAGFGYLVRLIGTALSPTNPAPPTVAAPVEQAAFGERAWLLGLSDIQGMRFTRAELAVSERSHLPLRFSAWGADGSLAERYEWHDTVIDPVLVDAVDFSVGYR
jgi:hypothetical protein